MDGSELDGVKWRTKNLMASNGGPELDGIKWRTRRCQWDQLDGVKWRIRTCWRSNGDDQNLRGQMEDQNLTSNGGPELTAQMTG
ncbi:hypothetical protein NPIL_118151 [Nephila pilipes]|uniref:Uncharacterized protein n=1 Tax=Nephila pilipes TaxID=299642 RepID=A0A8X6QBH2_NEPPI|nr:hypothetical protein NPIL_118151 [Nephila pilipes]